VKACEEIIVDEYDKCLFRIEDELKKDLVVESESEEIQDSTIDLGIFEENNLEWKWKVKEGVFEENVPDLDSQFLRIFRPQN
jgi:hypothetical protein